MRFSGRLGVIESDQEVEYSGDIALADATFADSDVLIEEGEKYVAMFDPLDASGNVKAGLPAGTIIGIYEHHESCAFDADCAPEECVELEAQCLADTLQPRTNLVAAAYCLYSSSTIMTLSLGNGVFMFSLDDSVGEFVLSKANLKIPESSSTYSHTDENNKILI